MKLSLLPHVHTHDLHVLKTPARCLLGQAEPRTIPATTAKPSLRINTNVSPVSRVLCTAPALGPAPRAEVSHAFLQRMSTTAAATAVAAPLSPTGAPSTSGRTFTERVTELWPNVLRVYDRAQRTGAASKTDTQVEFIKDPELGLEYVVRLATALNKKPVGIPSGSTEVKKEWRNPFLPYDEALWVQHLSDTHTLLLNKFNVVAHHLLVVTRSFESQQDPLNARDLGATWQVLKGMPSGGLAFYNCGENSGRSQPHKHLQIVPLPFAEGAPAQAPIQPIIEAAASASGAAPFEPFPVRQLPYRCYAAHLKSNASPAQLERIFQQLYEMCGGPGTSYNVVMTQSFMLLVPRSTECCGPCAFNSLAFAGTILVRSHADLEFVRQTGPTAMLAAVGQPWN